jgi:integrase
MIFPIQQSCAMTLQMEGLAMPAKVRFLRGKYWYVEINHDGLSKKLGNWMGQRFESLETAEYIAGVINQQILSGLFKWDVFFPSMKKPFLWKEAYWQWIESQPLAPSTYSNRKYAYQWFKHMEDADVRDLRSTDFLWIRDQFGDTPKAHSLRQMAQAFLNWFHQAQGTDRRIDLMRIKVPQRKTPYLDLKTRWKIYETMQDPYRAPTLLAIENGMRIGEICALQWQDIDWDGQGINVWHTMSAYKLKDTRKGGDEIWLPISPRTKEMLLQLKAQRPAIAGFVFCHSSGKQIWTQQLSSAFKSCCRSLGIPTAKFHFLRHSFLHDLSEAGASTREAAALAGHRSEKTTERYIGRWSKEKIRNIAELRGKK